MRARLVNSRTYVPALCCLLSYTLLVTLLAPPAGRVQASSGKVRGAVKAARDAAPRQAQAGAAPVREGELLVRFRAEVTERDKDDIASARGVRRRGKLRGESRLERL